MSTVLEENRRLGAQNQQLLEQNRDLGHRYRELRQEVDELRQAPPPVAPRPPAPNPTMAAPASARSEPRKPRYQVDYDDGFVLLEDAEGDAPYELKLNLWNQFRYTGFARGRRLWVDNAGIVRPITNRSDLEINRGRMLLSGFALDPRLQYFINLDYNTLQDDTTRLTAAWINYEFSDRFNLHFGKGKVFGTREFINSSFNTLGPDRTMATTFFRPSYSTGIWAISQLNERLIGRAFISDGFNTASVGIDELDLNFAYSGDLVWEPLGSFGPLASDLEGHDDLAIRLGTNGVYSRQEGQQASDGPEEAFIRLSDGTLLTEVGALAPGVELQSYVVGLWSLDGGLKYRGLSLTGEYMFRWLSDLQGDGPIPFGTLLDHGGYVQLGAFVLPERLELYARTSYATGRFGSGSEVGGGLNWFVNRKSNWRVTLDVTKENSSPAQQIRTGYQAGASGTLFRAQLQTQF